MEYTPTSQLDGYRYKLLIWAGYYKLHTNNRYLAVCHEVYRVVVIIFAILSTVQCYIGAVQNEYKVESSSTLFVIVIIFSKVVIKAIGLYIHTKDIQEIHMLLKDPIFRGTCKEDEKYLQRQAHHIDILLKLAFWALTINIGIFVMLSIKTRVVDNTTTSVSYYPFNTNVWPGYLLSLFWHAIGANLWLSYGHIAIDCSVASYFIRASTQLKMINYHLEHIFDDNEDRMVAKNQYKDTTDSRLHEQFVYCVKHYDQVFRLVELVTGAFKEGIAYHVLNAVITTGMCIYKMAQMNIFSADYINLFNLTASLIAQNLFYFYFGQLIENESEKVCSSMYYSDWTAVSPQMRRQMLVAMVRWSRPIAPKVYIIPLSLATMESILRTSYTFYTVMKARFEN